MSKTDWFGVVLAMVTVGLAVSAAADESRTWSAELRELNGSGVIGTAELLYEGGMLTVHVQASGLEIDRIHAQHIHGNALVRGNQNAAPGNATCPGIDADADGDGVVSVVEGLPYYGPVLLPLTPFSTTPFGTLDYVQTFSELASLSPIDALQNRVIVLHGLTIGGNYVPSTPVACGQIRPAPR